MVLRKSVGPSVTRFLSSRKRAHKAKVAFVVVVVVVVVSFVAYTYELY